MKKIKEGDTIAAIDIGSNYLKMSIAEIHKDKVIKILEDVIKPTNIGKDTFTSKKISIQTMHQTCYHLKNFTQLIKDYNVNFYKAISTSGIREAENKQYILEQIKLRTDLFVECINATQERLLMLKEINYNFNLTTLRRVLVINITSGAVEVSIYEEGQLKFIEQSKIGSLRLRETLGELEAKTLDFPSIMEQFIENKLYSIKCFIENLSFEYIIGLGGELKTISKIIWKRSDLNKQKIFFENGNFIKREDFIELYEHIRNMTNDQIRFTYNVSYKSAELLLPSILIFHYFLKITKNKNIQIPMASLRKGILYDLAEDFLGIDRKEDSQNYIISSVWYIAEKYRINKRHAAFVEKIALSIFDQTKKLHKLGENERLYLQTASILHDVGIFVDACNHCIQSYNIISSQNITGFSDEDLQLTANIARFDEGNNILWAKRLEKAGCHVIYGLVGLKTHCKILLVVRKESDGIKRYVHLGTGNYNDVTAQLYTDLGLFTTNPYIGSDASAVFNMLSGHSHPTDLYKLSLAPLNLRDRFLYMISQETKNASIGKPAKIIAKMNSLVDVEIIMALYKASSAGVNIYLIVRGICCLRPGIPGISENISVKSIVGKFLEHSRIYYFYNDGDETIYLSSADWMNRNLDRRIELLFPVEDKSAIAKVKEILSIGLADTVKTRILNIDGSYTRIDRRGKESINSQKIFYNVETENNYDRQVFLQYSKNYWIENGFKPKLANSI
ncbi:hypothetical protein [Clostridium ljungdahlii]|uniref:Polyphosphate kinase n=1 Tax=Clostridium ljungdahlii TaxID=1538 RepID=A0A162KT02_9CLOT|nr:hypothetical protein [Clostridium ljungdahlii]OAA83576.1 Polyphosphate kinase [Clostridium ljungdahlii]